MGSWRRGPGVVAMRQLPDRVGDDVAHPRWRHPSLSLFTDVLRLTRYRTGARRRASMRAVSPGPEAVIRMTQAFSVIVDYLLIDGAAPADPRSTHR